MAVIAVSILTGCLTLFYVGMVLYLRQGWSKVPYFGVSDKKPLTRVSVLIAARNEEEKIGMTIQDILNQDYPQSLCELIIVDDHSSDRTAGIVSEFAARGVRLIKLNEREPLNSYKKKAIGEAIKVANGELIITTDADCRMGPKWLKTIVAFYESGKFNLVSSPVSYFEEKNAFEEMQTLEFLFLIGLGAAGIGNMMPATCNGANLAYRKDVFNRLGGFKGIDDLASGDDELFLHKVASAFPGTVGFCKSRDAIVYTHAKPNLREFIQQRKRWASKSTRYKNKEVVFLGVTVWVFNLLFIINFVLGFYAPAMWMIAIVSLVSKMGVELLFLFPVCSFAKRKGLLFYQPLITVIHILYLVFIGVAGNSGKYIWKGRAVR